MTLDGPKIFAIGLVGLAVALAHIALYALGAASMDSPEVIIAPPCDTRANASDAADQLRARIAAGVANTECDLQQLDHVAAYIEDWERDWHLVHELELELRECEWGWRVDELDYSEHVEGTRIDEAFGLLMECAKASR